MTCPHCGGHMRPGSPPVDNFLASTEWRVVRMRVLERDGGRCACCGKTAKDGVVINVDHIKPRIRFPELALTESNLQVLCNACNHGKGNKFETDWRGPDAPPIVAGDQESKRQAQLAEIRNMAGNPE